MKLKFQASNYMKTFLFAFFLSISCFGYSQTGTGVLKGTVVDAKTKEVIPFVYVTINQNGEIKGSAQSDTEGNYIINSIIPSEYSIEITAIGYRKYTKIRSLNSTRIIFQNIELIPKDVQLNEFIVAAKKYEQKIADETVSTLVIDNTLIKEKAATNVRDVITQVPGLHIQEEQISIRGGAGFSYGAGSRVLLLVDGIPMLSGDAGDIKWNYLPIENINQIEILKGASSVLYGSSALNGAINIRTEYPTGTPKTSINLITGMYGKPYGERDLKWWDGYRGTQGMNFFHARQVNKHFDLVVGGNFFNDQSFRIGESEKRGRMNINTRFLSKKKAGLYYGVNANGQLSDVNLFFVWKEKDSVLTPSPGTSSISKNNRFNVDPYIEYFTKKGDKHSLKTRWFNTDNNSQTDPTQSSSSNLLFGDYQFKKKVDSSFKITSGVTFIRTFVNSTLYSNHKSSNLAFYSQLDKMFFKKLNVSAGIRAESYSIDGNREKIRPIVRAGVNYQVAKATFLRSSFGQGYRFASIAEKYASTSLGTLKVFPNPSLQSESGWSAELGIKQGIKLWGWKGFIDVAGFVNEYQNMNEYTFGFFDTTTFAQKQSGSLAEFGASSRNVTKARIQGIDVSLVGKGEVRNTGITVLAGYTYMSPKAVNPDSLYLNSFSSLTSNYTYDRSLDLNSDTVSDNLKYRFNHLLKFDIQWDVRDFSLGLSYRFNSFIHNIDESFNILGLFSGGTFLDGLEDYRDQNRRGTTVFDVRLSYQVNNLIKINGVVNNLMNIEYQTRPGWVMPPRNYVVQVNFSF
ncbi:MAG: outer membrane cobalamin receptor [Flavobacteriales bacterium]|jgi:outer membrane cobalamin receptor|tara:strand:+ start:3263 stop:5650 length:2388 start_codon:yes stop_codon:yes gene_type:complete